MKVVLMTLGVLFSLQVFAQNTVTYTYDSAGNRVARSAPKAPVASTSTGMANRTANQTDFALLLRNPVIEKKSPSSESGSVTSTHPIRFWNGQLNCFVAPAEPAHANEVVRFAATGKRKDPMGNLD